MLLPRTCVGKKKWSWNKVIKHQMFPSYTNPRLRDTRFFCIEEKNKIFLLGKLESKAKVLKESTWCINHFASALLIKVEHFIDNDVNAQTNLYLPSL